MTKAVGEKRFSYCVLTFWSFRVLSGINSTSNNTLTVPAFPHPELLHHLVLPTFLSALAEIQEVRNIANQNFFSF